MLQVHSGGQNPPLGRQGASVVRAGDLLRRPHQGGRHPPQETQRRRLGLQAGAGTSACVNFAQPADQKQVRCSNKSPPLGQKYAFILF